MSMRISYIGIESEKPDEWRAFADLVGLQPVADGQALLLRMDDHARRYIIIPGPRENLAFAGFEVDDQAALDAAEARLRAENIPVTHGTAEGAALRGVAAYIVFEDPNGIPFEIAHGCQIADTPFAPAVASKGFVTGAEGMGHIAIYTKDYAASEAFFQRATGALLSDHIFSAFGDSSVKATFLHMNPRHHSIAYAQFPFETTGRIDHVMIEFRDLADVLRARHRITSAGIPITISLGEHPNDHAISFYCTTPSGFRMELAAHCIKIDDADWSPTVYDYFSMWGHSVSA